MRLRVKLPLGGVGTLLLYCRIFMRLPGSVIFRDVEDVLGPITCERYGTSVTARQRSTRAMPVTLALRLWCRRNMRFFFQVIKSKCV